MGCVLFAVAALHAATTTQPVTLEGQYLRFVVDPARGGAITSLELVAAPRNQLHSGGLLQEGFGVASPYVPNRRLNEQLDVTDLGKGNARLVYSYDAGGPNIDGLHVQRTVEPMHDRASFRVTWRVENRGNQTHWIAPWVHHDVAPGGSVGPEDRVDVPSLNGVERVESTGYRTASRNWIAVTDTSAGETLFAVFDARHIHSYEIVRAIEARALGFKALFVPRPLAPGEVWETSFRIGLVRGLSHVDFATDEFAAQLEYENGSLKLLVSAAEEMPSTEIHARALGPSGAPETLQAKRFMLAPDALVRCTYAWRPQEQGAYDFLAQLRRYGSAIALGGDTHPPHGGVDTRIPIRGAEARLEPWTDAPFALDRGPSVLRRTLASNEAAEIWFEPSLNKIFQHDRVEPEGPVNSTHAISLAKNESESFQIVLRPRAGERLLGVEVRKHDLTDGASGAAIPKSAISVRRVEYVPVRIGSHFENPTGWYPDPLMPFETFAALEDRCSPLWVTVRASADVPAGVYRGMIELYFANAQPVELWLDVRVRDFALPAAPRLRTSFGVSLDDAWAGHRARGYSGSRDDLADLLRETAASHRVTLRDLVPFPRADAQFAQNFNAFTERLQPFLNETVTSLAVPAGYLSEPLYMERVNRWVEARDLSGTAFALMAMDPGEAERVDVIARMRQWSEAAPAIPMMVASMGLQPFFVKECRIWTAHSRIFDTPNNAALLERIAQGGEVWWYVNYDPPRPYANFFTDFAAVEHRALFWQAWALGVKGMYYWDVGYVPDGGDPYDGTVAGAPVNGNGLLLYPGLDGPVDSIRWETIRDGIEDYDYLALLLERTRALKEQGGADALVERASAALNVREIVPDLTSFSRDAEQYLQRRDEIGQIIEAMAFP